MITLITVNFNDAKGLEKTIQSVTQQTFRSFEYLVIDGGSTDGSVNVIKQYEDKINYWISEKDNGIYHAMNKGLKKAEGDYVLFLNSGDYLVSDRILEEMQASITFDEDIIYGDLILAKEDDQTETKVYPDKLTFKFFFRDESLPHPASFIRRELLVKLGYYNEEFRIVSDWEFWLRSIFLHQSSYRHIPKPITVYNLVGASSNPVYASLIRSEKEIVYNMYFKDIVEDYRKSDLLLAYFRSNIFLKIFKRLFLGKHEL